MALLRLVASLACKSLTSSMMDEALEKTGAATWEVPDQRCIWDRRAASSVHPKCQLLLVCYS